jgi:hypothetical protein
MNSPTHEPIRYITNGGRKVKHKRIVTIPDITIGKFFIDKI